jgi:hypothetical protein
MVRVIRIRRDRRLVLRLTAAGQVCVRQVLAVLVDLYVPALVQRASIVAASADLAMTAQG